MPFPSPPPARFVFRVFLWKVPEGEFGLLFTDGSKFGRAEQLHLALLGLWAFEKKEKRLPEAGNLEEAEAVVKLAEEVRKLWWQ